MRPRPENHVVRARAKVANSLVLRVESPSCGAVRKPDARDIAGRENNE
jgi:hypothetical protein